MRKHTVKALLIAMGVVMTLPVLFLAKRTGEASPNLSHASLSQQPTEQRLLTLEYGNAPHQIKINFPLLYDETDEEGNPIDREPPTWTGGPTYLAVSWDGQLFYIINPAYQFRIVREDDRELDTQTGEEAQEPSSVEGVGDAVSPEGLPEKLLVQVFDRRGRLVRVMASDLEDVRHAVVSSDGRLYLVGTPSVLSEEEAEERQGYSLPVSVEAYDREGHRDEGVERRIKEAMRSAVQQYSGKDWWIDELEVDRGGIVYIRLTGVGWALIEGISRLLRIWYHKKPL